MWNQGKPRGKASGEQAWHMGWWPHGVWHVGLGSEGPGLDSALGCSSPEILLILSLNLCSLSAILGKGHV